MKDTKLYDILKVEQSCSELELKKAYKKLILIHHPDKNGGDDSTFKDIDSAYKILSDPEKRKHYDLTGQIGSNTQSVPDTNINIFKKTNVTNKNLFFL